MERGSATARRFERDGNDNWAVPETHRKEHKDNGGMYAVFSHEHREQLHGEMTKCYRKVLVKIHPDKFNGKVLDKGMIKKNDERMKAYDRAYKGFCEWHDHALEWKNNEERWLQRWQQQEPKEFQYLETFETEFHIKDTKCASMDFAVYREHMGVDYDKYKRGGRKRRQKVENDRKKEKRQRR